MAQDGSSAGPAGQTVAVLGAGGTMGFAMARNIARAGISVRAWDRTRGRAEPLKQDGAFIAETPADAAAGATIVLTMLSDAAAVLAVMESDAETLHVMAGSQQAEPPVWLQMSTIGEEDTESFASAAGRYGVVFVDAPVLGSREPAEQGKLVVLASGPDDARPRVQPVFDAIGHRTIHAGTAGAGTRLKLVANCWVLSVVEAGAELLALAAGLDVDPDLFFQLIDGGPLDMPYLRMKARAMTEHDFTPSFRLRLAAKDAGLITDAAWQHGLDLPLFDLLTRRLGRAAAEHGDEDISATYLIATRSTRHDRARRHACE